MREAFHPTLRASAPPRESLLHSPIPVNPVNPVNPVKKFSLFSFPAPKKMEEDLTQRRKDAKDKKVLGAPCDCLKPFIQLSAPPRQSLPLLNSVNSVNSVKNSPQWPPYALLSGAQSSAQPLSPGPLHAAALVYPRLSKSHGGR